MSIRINKEKCIGCGKCFICPGNLINHDGLNKAYIKYKEACWGCTACLKECPVGAIEYYLGQDIGGKGGYLYTTNQEDAIKWHIIDANQKEHIIITKKQESNNY